MKTQQKGFTLIELMIVIAIIGILASVALPAYKEYIVNAQMSSVMASVGSVKSAINKNYSKFGKKFIEATSTSARKGKACAYNSDATIKNCWKETLGLRASPDAKLIEGISKVDIIAGTIVTKTTRSCAGFLVLDQVPSGIAAPAIQLQLTFDDIISADLSTKVLNLIPVFNPKKPQNLAWATTTTFDPLTDIGGIACKWVEDNLNSQWIK